mgnify:CR=1 FL=1
MSTQAKVSQPIKLNARIQKLVDNPDGKVKAIASVSIGGAFAIHGIKVIDSEKGKFVAMPNEKWTDVDGQTKYKDTFHAITAEARTDLVNTVMVAYDQKLRESKTQGKKPSEDVETASDEENPEPDQEL